MHLDLLDARFAPKPALHRWSNRRPAPPARPSPGRWIAALRRIFTPRPADGARAEPAGAYPPAPLDSRELSPWGPFTMRF